MMHGVYNIKKDILRNNYRMFRNLKSRCQKIIAKEILSRNAHGPTLKAMGLWAYILPFTLQ